MTNINFILNNTPITGLVEWMDTEICINIFGDDVSTNIDNFTFVGDSAKILFDYRDNGCNGGVGITEGVPFDIVVSCNGSSDTIKMYVDLFDNENKTCWIESECKVIAPVKLCENKETLQQCLQANSFAYLREKNPSYYDSFCVDIPYIVEKIDVGWELAFLAFATFMAIYQTALAVKQVVVDIVNLTSVQSFADAIRGILKLITSLIFLATMVIATINFVRELIDYIYPPIRKHKAMYWKDMLRLAYAHCGYKFKYVGIPELDCTAYLPSKPHKETLIQEIKGYDTQCIPLPNEEGYYFGSFINMVKKIFKAETYIKDGCVTMYPIKDDNRFRFTNYVMPKVQNKVVKYNTGDFDATSLLQFATDTSDGHTITEYKGVAFQRRWEQKTVNNIRKVGLRGLNECNIPLALGTRKNELSQIENAIKDVLTVFDRLINTFGGNGNFASTVTRRIGMLKVENIIHNVPKALFINPDGTIKQNHKDTFSAKPLFLKYHTTFKQQGEVEKLQVPFCCSDFNKVNCFKNFYDCEGRESDFKRIKWNIAKSYATIDYNYNTKYTNNLTNVDVEPE